MIFLFAIGAPRFAVFGGSGFVGSRVSKTLAGLGCDVVSVSRTGKPPAWAAAEPWSEAVEWVAADAFGPVRLGRIDGAVSCIGNVRPSPDWDGFFGLHWEYQQLVRENGYVTERLAEAAWRAGARRFVYLSVSSSTKWAYGGVRAAS